MNGEDYDTALAVDRHDQARDVDAELDAPEAFAACFCTDGQHRWLDRVRWVDCATAAYDDSDYDPAAHIVRRTVTITVVDS